MDILGDFLEEACIIQDGTKETAANLYSAFQGWAKHTGEKIISKVAFGERLGDRGVFTRKRGAKGAHYWYGLHLTSNGDAPIVPEMFGDVGDIGAEGDTESSLLPHGNNSTGPKTQNRDNMSPLGTVEQGYVTHSAENDENLGPVDPWDFVDDDVDQLDL